MNHSWSIVLAVGVLLVQRLAHAGEMTPRPLLISAHRAGGRVFAPDNSLPNIEHAVDLGVPLVEVDLRPTADGGLRRAEGTGPTCEFSTLPK